MKPFRTTNHLGYPIPATYLPNPFAASQKAHVARLKKAMKPKELAAAFRAREGKGGVFKLECFTIRDSRYALEEAAKRVLRKPRKISVKPDFVAQAIGLYGTATIAAETIRRHLDIMGDDVDKKVRNRAERLLGELNRRALRDHPIYFQ